MHVGYQCKVDVLTTCRRSPRSCKLSVTAMPVTLQTSEDAAALTERALLLSKAVQPSTAKAISSRIIPEQPGGVCCAPLNQLLTTIDAQLRSLTPEKRALALLLSSHALQLQQSSSDSARAPVPANGILTPALQAALLHEQQTRQAAGSAPSTSTASAAAANPGSSASSNPLVGKSIEDAVAYLIALLQEADQSGTNDGLPEMYRRRLNELGADVVWQTYCEAKALFDSGEHTGSVEHGCTLMLSMHI
jgi:hypothetical protein